MSHDRRAGSLEIVGWAALGALTGLVTGFALSEWVGGMNRPRLRRMVTRRPQTAGPVSSQAATARAAAAALAADAALGELGLEATAGGIGVVELHGWVPSRAARARASRIAGAAPGVERVVNRILVRGEDDLGLPRDLAADQSA